MQPAAAPHVSRQPSRVYLLPHGPQASTQFTSPLEVATKGWPGLPGKLAAYLQYKYASFRALGLGQAALDCLAKDRPGYGLR